jgi:hypothetical protein
MAKNKKHHYVPQFYLRNFSSDNKSIALYSMGADRLIARASIKKQCQEAYLYGNDGHRERALTLLEGEVATIFRKLLNTSMLPPKSSAENQVLILYIVTQHARTIYAAEEYEENYDNMKKYLLRPTLPQEGMALQDLDKVRFVPDDPVGRVLEATIRGYPLLLDLRGIVLENRTDVGFITSDNPVVLYNQLLEERRFAGNTGFQSVGLQVYLPVSANIAVLYYDRDVYGVGRRNPSSILVRNPVDVKQLNALQFLNASENVYFDHRRNIADQVSGEFRGLRCRRRTRKMNLISQRDSPIKPDETKELVGCFREEVRNDLRLTFLTILKRALAARPELMARMALRKPVLFDQYQRSRESKGFKLG